MLRFSSRVLTSRHEADGAEEAALGVVHLQRQQLPCKREHLICQRPKSSVVDLSAGQGQTIREGHGVLIGSVASANPQNLERTRDVREEIRERKQMSLSLKVLAAEQQTLRHLPVQTAATR